MINNESNVIQPIQQAPKDKSFPTALVALLIFGIFIILLICCIRYVKALKIVSPHDKYTSISQYDICSYGKSGDLLLFADTQLSAKMKFMRRLFQPHDGADWTHVGILYIDPKTNVAYVWEAIPAQKHQPWTDIISGKQHKPGPQLIQFHEKIKTYKGFCCLFRLSRPDSITDQELDKRFRVAMNLYKDYKFNYKVAWITSMVTTQVLHLPLAPKTLEKMHNTIAGDRQENGILCSELTILTYYHLGAWAKNENDFISKLNRVFPQNLLLDGKMGSFKVRDALVINM